MTGYSDDMNWPWFLKSGDIPWRKKRLHLIACYEFSAQNISMVGESSTVSVWKVKNTGDWIGNDTCCTT